MTARLHAAHSAFSPSQPMHVDDPNLEGLNPDQLATLKNRTSESPKMNADNLMHLIDPKLEFRPNEKHDVIRDGVGPQPKNGQATLDNSVSIKIDNTNRRVGIAPKTGEIVVFDDTDDGTYHGHVRTWNELIPKMRNALIDNGLITSQGKIVERDEQGNITDYGRNVIKGN
jgi:hypothetical protein